MAAKIEAHERSIADVFSDLYEFEIPPAGESARHAMEFAELFEKLNVKVMPGAGYGHSG